MERIGVIVFNFYYAFHLKDVICKMEIEKIVNLRFLIILNYRMAHYDDVTEYFCSNFNCNNSWFSSVPSPKGRLCDPCSFSISNTCVLCGIVLVPFYSNYYDENDNPLHLQYVERNCESVGMNPYACQLYKK